jgi:RNA polymerase sigma-70 factor (ECF subfamily)
MSEHWTALATGNEPQRQAGAGERSTVSATALAALPAPQREVRVLAEVNGLTPVEIGHCVGVGEQAVRGRLSRARARLATLMCTWR